MAERDVEVIAIHGEDVSLRALGACSDCSGCGGRCALFRPARGDVLCLPRSKFARAPRPGERWRLTLADDALLRQSVRGYGAALLGLLLGAAAGYALAQTLGLAPDLPTAAAALAGTLLAIRRSKRRDADDLRTVECAQRE